MRISEEEKNYLLNKIRSIDPNVKIYLFGSRAIDNKKGGDIDIMIISKTKLKFEDITDIRYGFMERFGEQKIDLINYTFDEKDSFKILALSESIEIS